jgi:serine/threonine protein kinase
VKKPIPFGKYVLLERINVGGMAEVFKAKAFGVEGFERLVAVKRILPSIAEDAEFITMFIDEAKIAVQLTHANIAQIFDLGRVADSYFIAMEYVHGKDLRAIFDRARKRGETVPVPMACYNVMKVCEGLDYAHNKKDAAGRELNLVHRDVSPQNILISYDGECKIIDFGIAKAAGKAGKTQAGILKGKFGYMSPEQVRGLPLDRRSDIFAVGIVLYELLTGERLFVGESDFSTLEKVRNVEIMPPSTYNRRIPEELEQIVLKALAKDVDDRYQTAMDLHDDLQSFMYTSGNFFSRKDLSAYMRKGFAEEIAKESQREEEYRRMEAEAAKGGGSGLDAFDNLDAAPAKAANISPAQARPPAPPPPRPPAPRPSGAPRNPTLMGGASASAPPLPTPRTSGPPPPPPRTSGPPAPPRPGAQTLSAGGGPPPAPRQSAPPAPPKPSTPTLTGNPSASAATTSNPGAALDMDWDDEELSTAIYDKPEDGLIPALPELDDAPPPAFSRPPAAGAPAPQPMFTSPSSSPGAVPGIPSPFDDLPSQPHAPTPAPAPALRMPPEPTAMTRQEKSGGGGGIAALIAVAVVLLLGVAGTGVWYFFLRSQPGTIHLATNPADAVVYLDGVAVTTSSASPFVLANVEPGQHLVEVRKHGFATWGTPVELESGQTLQLPAVTLTPVEGATQRPPVVAQQNPAQVQGTQIDPQPAQGTGFRLDTVPSGASVFIDDRRLAQTTPITVTDLAPGTHTIRAEIENYAPWSGQIDVVQNQVQQLPRAVLMLRNISVRFESTPPGARITLVRGSERRNVGETPTTALVDASGGAWTVEMTRNGYEPFSQTLEVPSGQAEHTLNAPLVERSGRVAVRVPRPSQDPPRPLDEPQEQGGGNTGGGQGTLRVNTTPWSEVFVDGRRIGNTPQMNIPLPAGRHTITLVNSEFNIRERVVVNISAGQTETLIRTLVPGGG